MAAITRTELMLIFRALCREVLPEVAGLPYHARARVVTARPGAVDVQILARDGSPDAAIPILPGLRVSGTLVPGTEVRVGFYYNDPAQAFIDAVLGDH